MSAEVSLLLTDSLRTSDGNRHDSLSRGTTGSVLTMFAVGSFTYLDYECVIPKRSVS